MRNEPNCLYDCLVSLAQKQCKCLPWDFVSNSTGNKKECDIFGRACFFNAMDHNGQQTSQKCSMCRKNCDQISYAKSLIEKQELSTGKNDYFEGGKYLKVDEKHGYATGSDVFVDFLQDKNGTLTASRNVKDMIRKYIKGDFFIYRVNTKEWTL